MLRGGVSKGRLAHTGSAPQDCVNMLCDSLDVKCHPQSHECEHRSRACGTSREWSLAGEDESPRAALRVLNRVHFLFIFKFSDSGWTSLHSPPDLLLNAGQISCLVSHVPPRSSSVTRGTSSCVTDAEVMTLSLGHGLLMA